MRDGNYFYLFFLITEFVIGFNVNEKPYLEIPFSSVSDCTPGRHELVDEQVQGKLFPLITYHITGQVLEFEVDEKPCFEIPLSNVSNCTAGKYEAVLEFHQNDDAAVSLMEMRLHIPTDPDADEDFDPVEVIFPPFMISTS